MRGSKREPGGPNREMPHCFCYCFRRIEAGSNIVILNYFRKRRYLKRIDALHESLGIPMDYARVHKLPLCPEAQGLCSIGPDIFEREQRMIPPAANAWRSMKTSAAGEQIELQVVSAFRSVEYQAGILRKKLEKGQAIGEILMVSAAPGFSEHHTGCALDLTTPGCAVLDEDFEQSNAFEWLMENAGRFSFSLSFPRDNPHGIAFEPWHWAWRD